MLQYKTEMETNVKTKLREQLHCLYTNLIALEILSRQRFLGGNNHENFDTYSKVFICKMTENQQNFFIYSILFHFTHASNIWEVLLVLHYHLVLG